MSEQSTQEVNATELALLESKIFNSHTIQDTMDDNHKMYTQFMCSEAADDAWQRQTATISYQSTMKLLGCIKMKVDPEGEISIEMTFE